MAGDSSSRCGAHVELAKGEGVRITQFGIHAGCGAVHVHVLDNAVTLRLGAERFSQLAEAIAAAKRTIPTEPNNRPPPSRGPLGDDSIN